MRARLGESLATVRKFDVPIQQATTRSLDALKAYALGVAQRAKGDDTGAIPFLEHAVMLDPAFALGPQRAVGDLRQPGRGPGAHQPRPPGLRQPRARHRARAAVHRVPAPRRDRRRAARDLYPRDVEAALPARLPRAQRARRRVQPAGPLRAGDRGGAGGGAPQPAAPVPALEPGVRVSRPEPLRRGAAHGRAGARAAARDAPAAAARVPARAHRGRQGARREHTRLEPGPAPRVRHRRRAGAGDRLPGPDGARASALPEDAGARPAPEPGAGGAGLRRAGRMDRGGLRQPRRCPAAGARRAAARAERRAAAARGRGAGARRRPRGGRSR